MPIHEQALRQHLAHRNRRTPRDYGPDAEVKRAIRTARIYGPTTNPATRAAWWISAAFDVTRDAIAETRNPELRAMWIEHARDNVATARARRLGGARCLRAPGRSAHRGARDRWLPHVSVARLAVPTG